MPYLDEDILYNNVEEKYKSAKGKAREAYSDVLDTICEMPRADVAPKSEVATKIFADLEKILFLCDKDGCLKVTALYSDYAELKKKYTEGKT